MPFIRARYHINAIAGEALEAAREAEEALQALEHEAGQGGDAENYDDETESPQGAGKGPIHRVEIEAAELVPSHTGRAQRARKRMCSRIIAIRSTFCAMNSRKVAMADS